MPLRYWLFVTLTVALTAFIGYGTYNTARLLKSWQPDRNLLLLPGENVVRLLLIALCCGLGLLSGLPFSQLGWVLPNWDSQLGAGVLWGALLAGFFYVTTRWLTRWTGERFYSYGLVEHIVPKSRRELALVSIVLVAVAALEELLFRSLLFGGLLPVASIGLLLALQGTIFGLMHSPQGVWGMIGAGAAGILFCLLFLDAGSLLTPLVAHYVANLIQVVLVMRERR